MLFDEQCIESEENGLLKTVYKDGELINPNSLSTIRQNIKE